MPSTAIAGGLPIGPQPTWADYYAGLKDKAVGAGTAAGAGLTALQQAAGIPSAASTAVGSPNNPVGGNIGSAGSFSSAPSGSGSTASIPGPQAPDRTAANAATFGAAKDQAGQNARGAITGLRDELAGRNMLGGGVEAGATEKIVNDAGQYANDITRQNAVTDAGIGEQNALAGYQGDITQRGQDLNAAQAMRAQDVTMRGQNISQQQAAVAQNQAALQGLLSAMGTLY